jgi:hypothetical protein
MHKYNLFGSAIFRNGGRRMSFPKIADKLLCGQEEQGDVRGISSGLLLAPVLVLRFL